MITGVLGALVKDAKKKLYNSHCIENYVINTKKFKIFSFILIITFFNECPKPPECVFLH